MTMTMVDAAADDDDDDVFDVRPLPTINRSINSLFVLYLQHFHHPSLHFIIYHTEAFRT